jgi:hypothetical protein
MSGTLEAMLDLSAHRQGYRNAVLAEADGNINLCCCCSCSCGHAIAF